MPASECETSSLAQNNVAHVRRCSSCGCVHLDVGALTIRLDDNALDLLRRTMEHAQDVMAEDLTTIAWQGKKGCCA